MEYPKINDQFKSIGNDFRSSIPHIYLGNKGISTNNNPNIPIQPKPLPNQFVYTKTYQNKPIQQETDLYEKIRKWALIIIILIVLGYAGYRILSGFL